MKPLTLSLLAIAIPAFSQAPNAALGVITDQASYAPGANVSLSIQLSGSTNAAGSPTVVQFQLDSPSLNFAPGCPIIAPATTPGPCNITVADPSKSSTCFLRLSTELFCVVFGEAISGATTPPTYTLNQLPIPNGPLVTIPAQVVPGTAPGPLIITLSNTDGTTLDATQTVIDAPVLSTGPVTVTITGSACDLNGDGKVDFNDVQLAFLALSQNQPGSIKFPLTLINVTKVLEAAITGTCTI